jgi:hypothetical protein
LSHDIPRCLNLRPSSSTATCKLDSFQPTKGLLKICLFLQ